MKIFFVDGILRDKSEVPVYKQAVTTIDAAIGITNNMYQLKILKKREQEWKEEIVIYTNSLLALDNKYAWNAKLKIPQIYIKMRNREFVRIDKLTKRKLREGNNLSKLYLAGEFSRRVKP